MSKQIPLRANCKAEPLSSAEAFLKVFFFKMRLRVMRRENPLTEKARAEKWEGGSEKSEGETEPCLITS